MSITVVSFNICPYVLRVVAAMHYKNLEFEVKYIDLDNKPDWFIKASPLEKVPILIKEDKVLFESNVILDYIDTTSPPSLQPQDPFEKSLARARMEFSGEVIGTVVDFLRTKSEEGYKETIENVKWYFGKIEGWLQNSQFLGGNEITLVDFAFVPIFTTIHALKPILKHDVFEGFPRLKEYAETLTSLPAVQKAKVPDYDKLILERTKFYGGWISQ